VAQQSVKLLLWISAFGVLIAVSIVVALILLADSEPPRLVHRSRYLHVRVPTTLSDAPGNEGFLVDPVDMPALTTELTAAVRAAATDEDIAGLFLEMNSLAIGWAQAQEIRSSIQEFQESGRPCVVWTENIGNKEYYLASVCDEVHLAPTGFTLVNGLSITQLYFHDAFERFGVSSNFAHVGDFKSAIEPYERSGPSEAAATATHTLLDSLFSQLVTGIAEGRDLSFDEALSLVNDPPMNPKMALETGLVDQLSYRDEVVDKILGESEGELWHLSEYLSPLRKRWQNGDSTVAVIHVDGTIITGETNQDMFGGQFVGDRTINRQLKDLREDENVDAVVLRVNSPGGSGMASDSIWREVELTKQVKPVVVSMGDYAASGGYYISMGADRIVAQPGTLTGSIGVFGGKLNMEGLFKSLGVNPYTFERGEYSNILSTTSDFDDDELAKFQGFLDGFYDTFVNKAATGRDMTFDQLHEVAQGRVWTGEQALERGLVDELGGLNTAIAAAMELANITGDVEILRLPERRGFFEQLMEEISNPQPDARVGLIEAQHPAVEQILDPYSELLQVAAVLNSDGVAAMLPGTLEIH